jgi:serine/threonine-protein kinase
VSTSSSRKYPELVGTQYRESELKSERPEPPERPESQYLSGDVIADRYRLVRKIGQGGMGVVWVAHSLVLGVDIALKLIRADPSDSGIASRMAREAHAAARLGHPALVRMFDFGWTNRGDPYLVMELVQGDTLGRIIRRDTKIPAIRAVQILLPIADGLRVAHERSIVHRDIKPDNIVLAVDALGRRQPKLLDFGIAKVDLKGGSAAKITQMGAVLGSPEYMSPEQALGLEDIDGRTDVWSLCIVLYEMLTGRVPFCKPNYNALMYAIIHEEPEPSNKLGEADGSLWQVLKKGLAKDRSERYANMTELGEALALWLYEHGIKEDISGNSVRAVWLDPTSFASNPAQSRPREFASSPPLDVSHSARTVERPRAVLDAANTGSSRLGTDTRRRRLAFVGAIAGSLAVGAVVSSLASTGGHRVAATTFEANEPATTTEPVALKGAQAAPGHSWPTRSNR